MSEFTFEVGKNIKFYREKRRMTLKELGSKIGISESTMQKYEAGSIKRVDAEMIKKIANVLKVPPGKITGWDKEANDMFLQGMNEAELVKKYSQLTDQNKLTISKLIEFLITNQE